jgi:hypothetical protein
MLWHMRASAYGRIAKLLDYFNVSSAVAGCISCTDAAVGASDGDITIHEAMNISKSIGTAWRTASHSIL